MVGIISSVVFAGLLTASPTSATSHNGFTFEGPEVTARTVGNIGYFTQGAAPFTDLYEKGTGTVELSVRDRVGDPRATYGDAGRLVATFTLGATTYRVELDQAGFPPPQANDRRSGPLPPPPAQAIGGGVLVQQDLHGGAPVGFANTTRVRATAAVWGVGRLWRNGALITDTALIHAAAIESGAHADDDTFRLLPVGRQGDTELDILVWNLPLNLEPRGFVQFDFDDVAISVGGIGVASIASIPTAGAYTGVVPPSAPVPGGVALGTIPTTSLGSGQGVGGSGLSGTGTGAISTSGLGGVGGGTADGLSDASRTEQLAPSADTTLPSVAARQQALPPAFQAPERVSVTNRAGQGDPVTGATRSDVLPDAFQSPERVRLSTDLPQTAPNGFVPLTSTTTITTTTGDYSVVPLVTGASAPQFAFGGARLSAGIVGTPQPLNGQSPAVPLISTPQPLNGLQPVPFIATPGSPNTGGTVPLISTPPPLGTTPLSATLPGAPTVVTNPAGANPFAPIR